MYRKRVAQVIFLLIVAHLVSVAAWAQLGTSGISGNVTDTTNAVVSGATIKIKNKATGQNQEITSDENGVFIIKDLPPAVYDMTIEAEGFAPSEVKDVLVRAGEEVTIKAKLKISGDKEVIVVKATDAQGVDTATSQVASYINDSAIASLPLNGRNFLDLALLLPGIATAPSFDPTKTNTQEIASVGQLGRGGNVSIDGADDNDDFVGGLLQNFPQDSVREFQIISNQAPADIGRTGSSAINVVTKNGTNDLHGSLGFFFRNSRLSALPATLDRSIVKELGRPPFDREQYTGSIGGPIKKDKAWYFTSFEYRKQDGIVLTGLRDSNTQQILNSYSDAPLRDLLYTARLDWQVREKDRMYFRYGLQVENDITTAPVNTPFAGPDERQHAFNHYNSIAYNYVHTFSAKAINDFTFQFNHFTNRIPAFSDKIEMIFPSISDGNNDILPTSTKQNRIQFRDSYLLNLGKHSLKIGGEYQHISHEEFVLFFTGSVFLAEDFPSLDRNGDGVINDQDIPILFALKSQITKPTNNLKDNFYTFYVQDDWKVASNFTLNLGVRYELQPDSTGHNYFENGFNPLLLPFVSGKRNRDLNNIGPRIGFNWDVFKNGKTSIHGGYGIFYDRIIVNIRDAEDRLDGRGTIVPVRIGSFVDPATGLFLPGSPTLADPFSGPIVPISIVGVSVIDNHLQNPLIQQFDFGIRQKLPYDMVLTVDGIHNFGDKLFLQVPIGEFFNPVLGGPQSVIASESAAKNWYDGLLINLEKRFSHNFQFIASYTLSKSLNYSNDDQLPENFINDPNNLRGEKGYSPDDQRNRFTFAGTYNAPYGIQISPIITLASSLPVDILFPSPAGTQVRLPFAARNSGARQFHTGAELNAYINQINAGGGVVVGANMDGSPIFGPLPLVNDNLKLGKGFESLDLRIAKTIKINDHINFQGYVEVFNLLNQTNIRGNFFTNFSGFQNVLVRDSNDPTSPGFLHSSSFGSKVQTAGGVFGTGGPRAFQFALRLNF